MLFEGYVTKFNLGLEIQDKKEKMEKKMLFAFRLAGMGSIALVLVEIWKSVCAQTKP